jgi:FHS family L-fucose permease-like MFS transporter
MGIPAGLMLQKIGYKKTALTAILVGIAGVAITFFSGKIESFAVYLIGAFVGGFSMCMLNTVVNPMLNTLGGEGKRGNQLLQFGGTLNSMGATIVPVLVGYLMGDVAKATISDANPALFLAIGIFVLAFIVLYSMSIPEPHIVAEKAQKKYTQSTFIQTLCIRSDCNFRICRCRSRYPKYCKSLYDWRFTNQCYHCRNCSRNILVLNVSRKINWRSFRF